MAGTPLRISAGPQAGREAPGEPTYVCADRLAARGDDAIAERQDLPVVSVRTEGSDPTYALRRRNTERNVRIVEPWDATLTRVAFLLVPLTIGPVTALVPAGVGALIDDLGRNVRDTWLVGGVGRVLTARRTTRPSVRAASRAPTTRWTTPRPRSARSNASTAPRAPRGVERAIDATSRPDCPVVPELLRPLNSRASPTLRRRWPGGSPGRRQRAPIKRSVVPTNGDDAEAPA